MSNQYHNSEAVEQSTDKKKSVRKAGRTLIVKSFSGSLLDGSVFDSLEGLTSKNETNSSSSFFLTFDTVQNAVNAFRKLRSLSNDYRIKYSYYRVFFTITGLTDTSDYDQVKNGLMNYITTSNTSSAVLYCKLYRKGTQYIGCGDLTLDTVDGMKQLLSKDSQFKNFSFDNYTGSFYSYNNKRDKV
jgi:hypothetical protein